MRMFSSPSAASTRTRRKAGWAAALLGGTMLMSLVASPASAFFGPVCIPRLQNCMCTFLIPCPVGDVGTQISTGAWRATLKAQQNQAEDMTEQFAIASKQMACDAMGSVPGLNAVGIDINAIIKANMPDINLDSISVPGLESLKKQMESLALDPSSLQDILDGKMTPDMFLKAAEAAGVDVDKLKEVGITLSSLQGLSKGDATGLLNMGLDRIGVDLTSIGMVPGALQNLSAGKITVDDFKALAGSAGVSQAQLDKMGLGIDVLHGLSSGDLSGMGLPNVDKILGEGSRISIDPGRIQKMLSGEMSPDRLLALAKGAGLSPSTLQTMGISPATLTDLSTGKMSPQQLLEVSDVLNFRTEALQSLGINEELLTGISSGKLAPDALLNVAKGAGLTAGDLKGLGLDSGALSDMVSKGPTGLMDTLQKAGLGNPILSGLNIDAGTLGKIAAGDLPASAISDMLAKSGLSPNAIVIPGVDGAVTALGRAGELVDGPLSTINGQLGSLNSQITQMINIPIPSIPGLGSVVGACGSGVSTNASVGGGLGGDTGTGPGGVDAGGPAAGAAPAGTPTAGGGDGTGAGGGTGTATGLGGTGAGGAVCLPNRPLISSTYPPNEMGPDVATIDFALAGNGDIFIQKEAIADAQAEANRIYAGAMARSIILRPLITQALDSLSGIEQKMALIDTMGTVEEAWKMNSAIKIHSMAAMAEIASLHSFKASAEAAKSLTPGRYTALPIFPHDSKWDEDFEETTHKEAEALKDISKKALAASQDYNDFYYQARALRDAHEMAVLHNKVVSTIPGVIDNINTHEAQKENVYYMETEIKSRLAQLYEDPEAAWKILQADMQHNAGDYGDTNKWHKGEALGNSLSDALVAQTATTRYGKRIQTTSGYYMAGEGYIPPEYSKVAPMPFSYPYVNDRLQEGDPMQISAPVSYTPDDTPVIPPMTGGIQNYVETHRRERAWAPIRRGAADDRTTSGAVWNEFLDFAPSCMSGPIPSTPSNLVSRPELFDITPSCSNLTWTDGDAEDYIAPSNFGGSDAILWQSKIYLDQAILQAGATSSADLQPTLAKRARDLLAQENAKKIEGRLRDVEYAPAADHTAELRNMLAFIEKDTALTTAIKTPTIQP